MDGKEDITFLIGFILVIILLFVFAHKPGSILSFGNNSGSASSTINHSVISKASQNSTPQQNPPKISSISNTTGPEGTLVTIHGSNFVIGQNTVNFGIKTIPSSSTDGKTLAFNVPQILPTPCNDSVDSDCYSPAVSVPTQIGSYAVTVSNSGGISNAVSFKLVPGYSYNGKTSNNPPTISNVNGIPNMHIRDSAVWAVQVSSTYANNVILQVNWGDGTTNQRYLPVLGQSVFLFGHTYDTAGNYKIVFTAIDDSTGAKSSTRTMNISVKLNAFTTYASQLALTSIMPSQAHLGGTIALIGTGFGHDNALIHWGTSTLNVSPSNYGTNFYFSVPAGSSPGSYKIYVSNSLGQITDTHSVSVIK
jgi:hypothetical protein